MQIRQVVFSKPAKVAALSAIIFLLIGLVMDGEYKRLLMAGGFGLILFVGGVIAERLRPTRRSAGTQ